MRTLLLLVLSVYVLHLNAQQALPAFDLDPQWNIRLNVWGNTSVMQNTYAVEVDACGMTWTETSYESFNPDIKCYIRIDGARAYVKTTLDCSAPEYLMYDFSLEIGDTLHIAYGLGSSNPESTRPFRIWDKTTILIGGEERILLSTDDLGTFSNIGQVEFIEGIGSTFQTFFSMYEYHGGTETYHDPLCYFEAGQLIHRFNDLFDCNGVFVSTTEVWKSDITLMPNPVQQGIYLDQLDPNQLPIRYQLIHLNGRVIQTMPYVLNKAIDVSELPQGFYVLQLENEKGQKQHLRFVKQ